MGCAMPRPRAPRLNASGRFITAERVGGSLMLLKRTVFEQVIAAYPGTRYTYDFVSRKGENLDCFALFDPLIIDEKYFPEDYAFCYRWRAAGNHMSNTGCHDLSDAESPPLAGARRPPAARRKAPDLFSGVL
jgi:hypothetical protein